MRTSSTLLALLAATSTNAHFLLNFPSSVGFSDDNEGTAPCGGFAVDFTNNNVTDFHVGGDAIALQSVHPQAIWLFRATLDQSATSGNWTTLMPTVVQNALGAFCEKSVAVPASWAGKKGVIGVVQDAPDGLLYQCAAVNFVSGTAASLPTSCTNATDLTAAFTADPVLSTVPATATQAAASTSDASSAGTSATSAAAAATSKAAAGTLAVPSYTGVGSLIWVGLLGGATFLAYTL